MTSPLKGVLYYSDNCLNMKLALLVRRHISASNLPITSVTLKPTGFGRNIHFKGERSFESMFQQILTGLEEMTEDVIYFAEHDVLYHPSHYEFTPPAEDVFYYNSNYWMLRLKDGLAVHYGVSPLSGLVAYREPLLIHMRERGALIEKKGFSLHIGYEPMTHGRINWERKYKMQLFKSELPNIDIAHSNNSSWKRWDMKFFRRKPEYWEESHGYSVPGWNLIEVLKGIRKDA